MLQAEHALDDGFAYRYSSLREFPLVELSYRGQDEIACPLPTLLFWRITNGLYYSLKDTPGFPTAFGKSFQRFVGDVLSERINNAEMSILEQREFQVGKNRKDSVDWIVLQGEQAALFLECKAKRLTWASKVGLSNLAALEQDIRKLAGAVVQVYKTIRDYREGRYPHLAYVEAIKVYPAIATLEDWYLFGHDLPNAPARRISPTRSCRCCSCPDSPYNLITTIVAMMDRPLTTPASAPPRARCAPGLRSAASSGRAAAPPGLCCN